MSCLFLAIARDKKRPKARINKSSRKFFPWKFTGDISRLYSCKGSLPWKYYPKTCPWTSYAEAVLKTIIIIYFILIRKRFFLVITISCFPRCLHDILEDEKLLHWRCLQDFLETNKCLLGYNFVKLVIFSKFVCRLKACNLVSKGITKKAHRKLSEILERAIL